MEKARQKFKMNVVSLAVARRPQCLGVTTTLFSLGRRRVRLRFRRWLCVLVCARARAVRSLSYVWTVRATCRISYTSRL